MAEEHVVGNYHGAPKAPHGSAKRCPPPKAARSATPPDPPKKPEHQRRDRLGSQESTETRVNRNTDFPCMAKVSRVDGNNPQG